MRRLGFGLVGVLAGSLALSAQQQAPPVFRAGVTLVRVDVTVVDRESHPVQNLTADDFEIKLDGQVRAVRALDYEQVGRPATAAIQPASTTQPAREVSNAAPVVEPRLVVMLLDDLSIPPSRGKGMFFAATRFVDALPPSDVVGFTVSSGTATLNPTQNRAAIDAALRHTAGEFIDPRDLPGPAVGITDALEVVNGDYTVLQQLILKDCFGGRPVSQAEMATNSCAQEVRRKTMAIGQMSRYAASRQLQSYLNVINAMKQAPGMKELVVISDGLGVASREQSFTFSTVARAASAAGVQLSVLSPDPDMIDLSKPGAASYADNRNLQLDLQTMTELAGGTFYRVMGQPDRFFNWVALATSAVYHLGVEAPAAGPKNGDFAVVARVKRSGLTVHANRVALVPTPVVAVSTEDQLRAAVAKGLPNYGVPVTLATALRRGATESQLDLGANLDVPATAPGPLTVMYGLVDHDGTLTTGRRVVAASTGGDYRVSLSLPVTSGAYRLRFAVADAEGHVGSLEAPVKAALATVGPFLVSDILTTWNGADRTPQFLALEEVPASATTLRAFLELYPGSPAALPADVQVSWRLVGNAAPGVRVVSPTRSTDRLTASAEFSLDGLAVGTYELEATVSVAGASVGTVSTTFRKAAKENVVSRFSAHGSAAAR
jgi:VWFA-related protein